MARNSTGRKHASRHTEDREPHVAAPSPQISAADRLEAGKALRDTVPRDAHARWKREKARVDPIAILRAGDEGRIGELVPIRYGRMLRTPFTFFRGAAAVMAADLARTPATGIRVQACGDCHLLNSGGFATPERNILFDINDFDETLPAPWEWDVKRLVASFVLAARSNGLSESAGRDAAVTTARSYRKRMREYSRMSPLEVWYARVTADDVRDLARGQTAKERIRRRIDEASGRSGSEIAYPKLAGMVGGHVRIHDDPPLIFHPEGKVGEELIERLQERFATYRDTLSDDRRAILDRYRLVDGAMKVVGIGSVGTACSVLLLMSAANDPLFLQVKEARRSVLEDHAGPSVYPHAGQRVGIGQRLMQPASDIFLGWATGQYGRQVYVRQLRDAKIPPIVEAMDADILSQFGKACGWALARAHAKAGDALSIAGYLGTSDQFDVAMGRFAVAYADQTERDHAALKAAVRAGTVKIRLEE